METKFEIDAQGNLVLPDFTELKKKLAENLKSGILGSLPDEFFDHQVQTAFEALTKPRANMPATGDRRCESCKPTGTGWDRNKGRSECPHNIVERPSEIQEMIQDQMREHISKKVAEFSVRWTENANTDKQILNHLEKLVVQGGQAVVLQAGQIADANQR